MATTIGLNVLEVDGATTPTIVGAAVSVGAFDVLTRRGVANRPTRINSFAQFVDQFGGYFAGGLGAYLVRGFFDNGGQTAYINRVVASDATTGAVPAQLTLQDGAGRDTLQLRGGYRGRDDPGTWGNDLFVRVSAAQAPGARLREITPATLSGAVLVPPINMVALPGLSVRVDGATDPTVINFQTSDFANAAQATLAEIRDAINRRTPLLAASVSNDNRLVLTSTGQVAMQRKGGTSLQIAAANATLGFPDAAPPPTLGTLAARAVGGTRLASVQDLQVGDAVRISDGANSAVAKVQRLSADTGDIGWAPDVANIAAFDATRLTVTRLAFDLNLRQGVGPNAPIVETWTDLSMEPDVPNYAPTMLNDTLVGSHFLTAADRHSTSGAGANQPAALDFSQLRSGRDGTPTANDFIGDPAAHTGFYAFDPFDVQLVGCERTDPAIVSAALGYCANRGDCVFVGSVPEFFVAAGQAVTYGQNFQGRKVYGALYGPWIKIFDPLGSGATPLKWVPPTGHVMGMYARIESTRGIWKAPAGDEANLVGALDVEYRLSDAEHTDLVKNGSVNGVRIVPGAGIVVDASRTLSTDTRWQYVNVRLLFNYVKGSLKLGLRWVRQEPNRDTLWNAVKFTSVTPFLMGLWRQGAFGTGRPEQVFTVICDSTNNPPDQVDQGNFKVEVYFYPSKPAETILIVVGQQRSGASAAEA